MTDNDIDFEVERLIDSYDFEPVLESLARVCSDKAEHIATNYDDPELVRLWENRAARAASLTR